MPHSPFDGWFTVFILPFIHFVRWITLLEGWMSIWREDTPLSETVNINGEHYKGEHFYISIKAMSPLNKIRSSQSNYWKYSISCDLSAAPAPGKSFGSDTRQELSTKRLLHNGLIKIPIMILDQSVSISLSQGAVDAERLHEIVYLKISTWYQSVKMIYQARVSISQP